MLRQYKTDPNDPDGLLLWLDGAVAVRAEIPADALNIRKYLGPDGIPLEFALEGLRVAWKSVETHPTASLQRQLWERLLTLVYGREIKQDALWLQHTFLVIVAKSIAAHIMEVERDNPVSILSGQAFRSMRIFGALESDFFDWILLAPSGPELVQRIARHVERFRLREVQTDVLKILYESLIDREERHGLGEYYTPDWLAAKIVRRAVTSPVEQKVLDPACSRIRPTCPDWKSPSRRESTSSRTLRRWLGLGRRISSRMRARNMAPSPTLELFEIEARRFNEPSDSVSSAMNAARQQAGAYARAGGDILFGADVGYADGFDTRREFELLRESGFDLPAVLASLTTAPARRFGPSARKGRIAPGMDADLVVLADDPSADLMALSRVRQTIRAGRLIYEAG